MDNGFSLTLCFGRYAGFYFKTSKVSTRFCLGWAAFSIYWTTDLEAFISHLRKRSIQ